MGDSGFSYFRLPENRPKKLVLKPLSKYIVATQLIRKANPNVANTDTSF